MKLYVCYGTFKQAPRPGGHPCGQAFHALKDAGHDPEVVKAYGLAFPGLDRIGKRNEVEKLSGQRMVPILVLDDGEVINDSKKIIAWAKANPAGGGGMKLYVCWGTFGGDWHHCQVAHAALTDAGHDPEVVKVHGWGVLPDLFNGGRKAVKELTGEKWVPVLVTDSGEVVNPTDAIVTWAKANPAGAAA